MIQSNMQIMMDNDGKLLVTSCMTCLHNHSATQPHSTYHVCCMQGGKKRTLYNKNFGHSEWVTCCCYTGAGACVCVSLLQST